MTESPQQGRMRPYSRAINAAMYLLDAGVLSGTLLLLHHHFAYPNTTPYIYLGLATILLFHISGSVFELYRSWRTLGWQREAIAIAQTWAITAITLLGIGFVFKLTEIYSRKLITPWILLAPLSLIMTRIIIRSTARHFRKTGHNSRTAAIVGVGPAATTLGHKIETSLEMGLRFTGYYFDGATPADAPEKKGGLDELINAAKAGQIDNVYVALPFSEEETIKRLTIELADTTASLYVLPDFFVLDLVNTRWDAIGDQSVISVYHTPMYGVDGAVKRVEDIALTIAALPILVPAMLAIGAIVKLTSPGPAFYRQKRYGIGGQEIEILKFRSMTVTETDSEFVQATRDDQRVTPVGAFLRRWSLDELPQFINVLQGNMSIIGPRPHAVSMNEAYRKQVHGYMLRHKVKPGISGWAQVNGWRGETDTMEKMEKRIEHDLDYIRNWSLTLDLKIIFLTLLKGLRSPNAY